ncbi:MAG: O-antigen ligase family protein [Proteobacteria bacterium]|nr:O-antigen ligase family protein [Pseudomonadota bacterium]MBU1648132.1 O-antigen ligase family protein [Pseudomonadota bacterium]
MNERILLRYIRYLLSGLFLGVVALKVSALPTKYYLGIIGAILFLAPAAYIYLIISTQTKTRLICLFVATFTFGIAFNLDYNFFYRDYVGVTSVDISVSLLSLLVLFCFFVYDAKLRDGGTYHFQMNRKILIAFLLYIAAGFLSLVDAEYLDLSLLEITRLLSLLFLLFVITNLQDRKYIDVLLLCLSIDLVLESCIGLYQFKTGHMLGLQVFGEKEVLMQDIGFVAKRSSGTIGDPNIFGYFFEMLIPLMFAMFIAERRFLVKCWYLFAVTMGCAGIYTTLSRGAWMTIPLSFTLVFFVMFRGRFLRLSTFIWVWCALLVFSAIIAVSFPVIYSRFTHDDYGSADTRKPLNEAAFSVIRQFPVFGVGLNNMASVFKKLDTTGYSRMFVGKNHVVHNMYLQIWSEVGTVGIIAFMSMLIIVLYTAFYHLYRVHYWDRGILAGGAAGIMAQAVHAMVDPGFKTMMNMSMLFYTFIGLIGAISIIYRNENAAGIVQKSPV